MTIDQNAVSICLNERDADGKFIVRSINTDEETHLTEEQATELFQVKS